MTRCTFLFLALLSIAFAADVTGKWNGSMNAGDANVVFDLKSDGSKVTGTMSGADGKDHPITSGTLDGDKISLKVASEWQGDAVTLLVNGTVSGSTMKLTIASENGQWSSEATVTKT